MRILFICSSLELGHDGVGDYTRSLAAECARAGHEVSLMSLHDRHIQKVFTEDDPQALRLPANLPWTERVSRAESFVASNNPEWISLHFVPYGFHDKGLVWNLPRYLQPLTVGRKVQVTFHELWIGAYRGAAWKDRVVGRMQRAGIFRLMRSLSPSAFGTSNAPYVAMLSRGGIYAHLLPMFGSIPFAEEPCADWLYEELRADGVSFQRRDELWIFAMFGALHSVWPAEPLFTYLQAAGERHQRKIVIASLGRLGAGDGLWNELRDKYAGRLHLVRLGPRSAREVSVVLQEADFGIATSPWELIGKSSSAATLLEHGLPVIVNRDEIHFGAGAVAETFDPLLVKMGADLAERLPHLHKGTPQARLPASAKQFLCLLEQSSAASRK